MQIIIDNKTITFDVQYAKRKKMHLDITPEGFITVKVPSKTLEPEIHDFIQSNATSILNFMAKLENRRYVSNVKSYSEAENFLYLGKAYQLIDLLEAIPESEEAAQLKLKKFYTTKTKELVKKRVKHFEKVIGVKSKSVTIVDSPRTWGTCSSLKDLTFNYKLSMAPMHVIDYVVIHELCHILHLNHDRSFWRKVGTYDSNYKQNQEYLASFGHYMTI
ncbi:MAG: M48 family metallopeptidase [Turicibacter sp.]